MHRLRQRPGGAGAGRTAAPSGVAGVFENPSHLRRARPVKGPGLQEWTVTEGGDVKDFSGMARPELLHRSTGEPARNGG